MSAHTGVCIVWPAWFLGSTDSGLHCTALFLGHTTGMDPASEATIREILSHVELDPGPVRVIGRDLFGRDKKTPVLLLENPALDVVQAWMARELDLAGIMPSTEFPFTPHVTLSKEAAMPWFPHFIQLEAPVLWWGGNRQLHSKHIQEVAA